MYRIIATAVFASGLAVGVLGCGSDNSAQTNPSNPSGTPAQTPQGNMQGPAHSNGTEGADTAQNQPPVAQSAGTSGTVNQSTGNQGQLPTTQPQP